MLVKIINTTENFKELEYHWNLLHNRTKGTIFQSFDWNYNWWKIYKQHNYELFLITLWENEQLMGILPLYTEKLDFRLFTIKRTRLLCTRDAYGDYEILIDPTQSCEIITTLKNVLNEYFNRNIEWLSLFGFDIKSKYFSQLIDNLSNSALYTLYKPKSVRKVVMNLPDTWDDYLNSLSKNEKTLLMRKTKSLMKYNVEIEIIKNGDIRKEDFYDFIELHTKSWNYRGFPGFFESSSSFKDFLEESIIFSNTKNNVRLYFLKKDNKRFSSILVFFCHPNCYFHLSGMIPDHELLRYSPGKILLSLAIKDSINEGYRMFDFQGGEETYKYQLGGKTSYYSKVNIFKINIKLPILLILYFLIQLRQVIITLNNYNSIFRAIKKIMKKLIK